MTERNNSIDLLKAFCIIGVICIHVNGNIGFKDTFVGQFINIIIRICVPLFFIISGYFIYNKITIEYIKKYILKLIIVYIISVLFYCIINETIIYLYYLIQDVLFGGIFNFIFSLYYAIYPIEYHLWYLFDYIILIPIIYIIIKNKLLEKVLGVSLILNILGVFLVVKMGNGIYTRDALFLGLFYITVGCFIKKNENKIIFKINNMRSSRCISLILILLCICFLEQSFYIKILGYCGDYFITTIPLAIFIFMCCLTRNIKKIEYVNLISKNTLYIYIIHVFFITQITKYFKFNGTLLNFILLVIEVLVLSVILVNIPSVLKSKLKNKRLD